MHNSDGMTMQVQIRFFAVTKELVGDDTVEVELEPNATVADLRRALLSHWPELESVAEYLRFSVGVDLADDATTIPPNTEVACIPPVSGG